MIRIGCFVLACGFHLPSLSHQGRFRTREKYRIFFKKTKQLMFLQMKDGLLLKDGVQSCVLGQQGFVEFEVYKLAKGVSRTAIVCQSSEPGVQLIYTEYDITPNALCCGKAHT